MRKIITTTFVTADGVMQAPGGPEEDTSGGFSHGGWMFPYTDDLTEKTIDEFIHLPFELLLGKHTYDIWAPYWPTQHNDIATAFNGTKKYVVSHHPAELSWQHSTLITGDVPAELRKLKEADGPDLWVHGSGNLIQTLLAHHLIDVMHVWTFPVTVGGGKRLFEPGIPAREFKLVESKISPKGVVIATYEPGGPLRTGSFV